MLFVRNSLPFYGLQRSVSLLGVTIPIYELSAMKRLLCKKNHRGTQDLDEKRNNTLYVFQGLF